MTYSEPTSAIASDTQQAVGRLAAIVTSTDEAIIGKTPQGVITDWNAAAERLYGYRAAEVIGQHITILAPAGREREIEDLTARLRSGERIPRFETQRRRKDGTLVEISLVAAPILDASGRVIGASAIAHDITERRAMEVAILQRERELEDFLEHAPLAVHWLAADGTLLRANHAAIELAGWPAPAYLGRPAAELYVDAEFGEALLRRLQRGETVSGLAARLRTRAGPFRQVTIDANGRFEDGRLVYSRCFLRDVTEQAHGTALLSMEKDLLEGIVAGKPLLEVLDALARALELLADRTLYASILLVDADGEHLRHAAAPSLPDVYNAAIDGAPIGPASGSCGTAAYRRAPVIVRDIATDPLWDDWRDAALPHGLRACWSTPIQSADGRVLATFALYYTEPAEPTEHEQQLITLLTRTAAVAIEHALALEALRQSEDRFRTLADNIAQLAWMAAPSGERYWFNRRWYEFTGTSLASMQGWGWTSVHHPDHVDRVLEGLRRAWKLAQPWEDTFPMRGADGKYRWFLARAVPIRDASGNVVQWFGTNTDVTAQRDAEDEREQLLQRELAAREAAEGALRVRDAVVSFATHDLRSPLTTVRGHAQLLRRHAERGTVAADRVVSGLATIEAATAKMEALLSDLLDSFRLQAGQELELHREPTDLVALVRRCMTEQQTTARGQTLRLVSRHANLIGNWDGARLERVVNNLLSNAVKYNADGEPITVTVGRRKRGAHVWAELTVRDHGIGIPAADLPHIFEQFHRAANVTGSIRGTGLGLSGSKRIVEQHGGAITVTSEEGAGTSVSIRLPA